jgi:fructose-1,6-bisphosphatase/inositol monophosphatase family enzyme
MDIAPGCLFIEEACGTVTDFTCAPWSLYSKNIVASNGQNHADALHIVQSALV